MLDLRDYNGFGQLIRVFRDGVLTTMRYRPDGMRHSKATSAATAKRSGDKTTVHHWDGSNIVSEAGIGGNIQYIYGIGPIGQQDNGIFQLYLRNAHGDVAQLLSEAGVPTPEYRYDSFGNQKQKADTDRNPLRYCGEYYDKELGEVYLRTRYYNPRIGRFGAEDIARSGLNWYTYCVNNPVSLIDPMGLTPWMDLARSRNPGSKVSVGYTNKQTYGDVRGASSGNKFNSSGLNNLKGATLSRDAAQSVAKATSRAKTTTPKYYLSTKELPEGSENLSLGSSNVSSLPFSIPSKYYGQLDRNRYPWSISGGVSGNWTLGPVGQSRSSQIVWDTNGNFYYMGAKTDPSSVNHFGLVDAGAGMSIIIAKADLRKDSVVVGASHGKVWSLGGDLIFIDGKLRGVQFTVGGGIGTDIHVMQPETDQYYDLKDTPKAWIEYLEAWYKLGSDQFQRDVIDFKQSLR